MLKHHIRKCRMTELNGRAQRKKGNGLSDKEGGSEENEYDYRIDAANRQ